MSDGVGVIRTGETKDETTYGWTERNAPCPCVSCKKYKQCHWKNS
jgi:uncharacterized protein YecA (UPF0149 family)